MRKADNPLLRRRLRNLLNEVAQQQAKKRIALEAELERSKKLLGEAEVNSDGEGYKALAKAQRRADLVPEKLAEVDEVTRQITALSATVASEDIEELRRGVGRLGLADRFAAAEGAGDNASMISLASRAQRGRPSGFDGLVFESPCGIPTLVAQRRFADALLRRVGRGSDLFFQVRDGSGSRVLLRTSMRRDLGRESPRECMEFAADLAGYFSDHYHTSLGDREVEIMFTDARHVAKRGTRVGQMKDSKKLGYISARPQRVATAALKALDERADWLAGLER